MSSGIFVTATGTNVGKTYVAALMTRLLRENGINAGYYKAALSEAEIFGGALVPGDAKFVADMAGLGAINGAVLTAAYAGNLGIMVKGIILNNYDGNNFLHTDNKKTIERLTGIKVIACVGQNDAWLNLEAKRLCELYGEV